MVGLGAVPAALQIIFLFFLPESRESRVDMLVSLIHRTWSSQRGYYSVEVMQMQPVLS